MSADLTRTYSATFKSPPTIKQIKKELERAETVFSDFREVEIEVDSDGWIYLWVEASE